MHGEDYVCLGFRFGERYKVAYISDISRFLPSSENCKHCHSLYLLLSVIQSSMASLMASRYLLLLCSMPIIIKYLWVFLSKPMSNLSLILLKFVHLYCDTMFYNIYHGKNTLTNSQGKRQSIEWSKLVTDGCDLSASAWSKKHNSNGLKTENRVKNMQSTLSA